MECYHVKKDQLIDILQKIQARKLVTPEDAAKALTQYRKVQEHIKTLKEEIQIFKNEQNKKSQNKGSGGVSRRHSVSMANTIKNASPFDKSPPKVLNGPKVGVPSPSKLTTQPSDVSKPSPRTLNGPPVVEPEKPKQSNNGENGKSVRRASVVSATSTSGREEIDKDKEIARLRLQNAQLKVIVEKKTVSTSSRSEDQPRPSAGPGRWDIPAPEKLVDDFRKIYDMEWRSAYHDLEKHYKLQEDNITELLGGIAREAYQFLQATAKQQFDDITKGHAHVIDVISMPRYISPSNKDVFTPKSKSIVDKDGYQVTRKYLRDYRRSMARVPIPGLIEIFENLVQRDILTKYTSLRITPKATRPYIHRLVEVVWFMSLHEPPVTQVWPRGGQLMNRDWFSCYSKKGATIIHTVWPAVLINKDGPAAEKGIVLVK